MPFFFFFSFFIFSGRIIKIFCWFLLYISMGQAWVYILTPPAPSHPSNLSQSTSLSSLSHIASSHWLSVLHVFVYIFPCYSPFTPPSSYTPNSLYYCVTPYYCALPACQLWLPFIYTDLNHLPSWRFWRMWRSQHVPSIWWDYIIFFRVAPACHRNVGGSVYLLFFVF